MSAPQRHHRSIHQGRVARSASGLLHLHGGRTRPRRLSGPASKTRLPRTSKPCWRPRRWSRSPTSPNPGRRTRPSARTPTSAFRPNRCTAGCARARPFYQINSVVDANNPCLARNGFLPRLLDTARIGADIVFRLGKAGEVYPGIGKDDIALENMPLLAGGEGAFGSPTSDSTRAMITQETRSC